MGRRRSLRTIAKPTRCSRASIASHLWCRKRSEASPRPCRLWGLRIYEKSLFHFCRACAGERGAAFSVEPSGGRDPGGVQTAIRAELRKAGEPEGFFIHGPECVAAFQG